MTKHGIVRTDNMAGTHLGEFLVSGKYTASNVATDIDNGCFVVVGNYLTGEREVRAFTAPVANTPLDQIALIASEEVDKEKNAVGLAEFYNKAGKVCRGYIPHDKDCFSLTAEAFDVDSGVTPTAGTSVLTLQAGVKGKLLAAADANVTTVAKLEAIEMQGATKWYVFRVQ